MRRRPATLLVDITGSTRLGGPGLAGWFQLLDPDLEVPGAGGVAVAVYALRDPARILT